MSIFDYLNGVVAHIKRNEVVEDIEITRQEFEAVVQPLLNDISNTFSNSKFNSKEVKELESMFYRNFKQPSGVRKGNNFILTVKACLEPLIANLDTIDEQAANLLETDVLKDGLTPKKTVLLRGAEQMSFISRFTVDLLDYVLCKETAQAKGGDTDLTTVTPAFEKKINEFIDDYARVLSVYAVDNKKFVENFAKIPDLAINPKAATALKAVYGDDQLDPFNSFTAKNFFGNPIYHFRLQIAEWQNSRYQALRDKKRMLELRILHLELEKEKATNPKIEQELEYIRNRVESIESKMRDLEE